MRSPVCADGTPRSATVIAPAPAHADIASRVATQREAVTRKLNALAGDGRSARRDRAPGIADVTRLAPLVETGLKEWAAAGSSKKTFGL